VGRTVGNKLYQVLWFIQQLQQLVNKVQVSLLIAATDVVYFAGLPFPDDGIQSPAVVAYKDPVPDIEAITIDRYWFVLQGVGDSQRN
jgi:hypothetical protein